MSHSPERRAARQVWEDLASRGNRHHGGVKSDTRILPRVGIVPTNGVRCGRPR